MKVFHWLKNFFFKPSKLGLGVLLVTGAIAGIIAWIVFNTVMEETSTEEFCVSCHSMQQPLEELKEKSHFSNKFGVSASCGDCHVPHKKIDKYIRKIEALKEVFAEVTGKYDEEGSFEKHRLEMAEREWARMSANGSQACKNCHRYDRMKFDEMKPAAREAMKAAAAKDQSCIDCHKGISHHLPKPKEVEAVSDLTAGTTYFTKESAKLFSDEAMQQEIGYLETAVPVKFVKSGDKSDLVEFTVWRKAKGFGRIGYHEMGKNITDAVLTKAFMKTKPKQYEVIEKYKDSVTRLKWQKIKLQAWVTKSQLIENIDTLWAKAEGVYKTQCSVCHKQPDVAHFDANTWIGLFNGMVGFTSIDETTGKQVLRYLQMHSSDFEKHPTK
ncbi:pentaheme c-type cytochrome TorC [Pasteurella atlantica]|uniref:pentaheme c-type cytochrome TorC n=1 Tax=Pasteurellaceae TaxID=712 RepID=UPI00275BD01D|nr:pentaheme c-type cytochrome TorC [Pasteurella atlantica]MDP8033519.1 pentaheme c-type cytochrome TorC [Pasteurella atlantica]MDP8035455.1 pentaheme c-type cytochrome TorC [Pasteurella atlantica]MDP8037406.1 pentaheme c-type cytochrome TorC [Pasteurella atlantica]MDP8047754.1 pentaheme c-type cytochrome TorC [Pasteurella atlantica]MDP8049685.1 pentaheme c-type cytochrome TorC [Pasteurella atlantica]